MTIDGNFIPVSICNLTNLVCHWFGKYVLTMIALHMNIHCPIQSPMLTTSWLWWSANKLSTWYTSAGLMTFHSQYSIMLTHSYKYYQQGNGSSKFWQCMNTRDTPLWLEKHSLNEREISNDLRLITHSCFLGLYRANLRDNKRWGRALKWKKCRSHG